MHPSCSHGTNHLYLPMRPMRMSSPELKTRLLHGGALSLPPMMPLKCCTGGLLLDRAPLQARTPAPTNSYTSNPVGALPSSHMTMNGNMMWMTATFSSHTATSGSHTSCWTSRAPMRMALTSPCTPNSVLEQSRIPIPRRLRYPEAQCRVPRPHPCLQWQTASQ